jgi:hypothetical protein
MTIIDLMELLAVNQRETGPAEQNHRNAAIEKPSSGNDPIDEIGRTSLSMLREAADNYDRAKSLLTELRAAQDQIAQLESQVRSFRDRATRAEGWLKVIQEEIENKLINRK